MAPDTPFDFQPPSQTASIDRLPANKPAAQSTASTVQQRAAKYAPHSTSGSQADSSPQPEIQIYGDGKPRIVVIEAKVMEK